MSLSYLVEGFKGVRFRKARDITHIHLTQRVAEVAALLARRFAVR